jgi:hypothetical protein
MLEDSKTDIISSLSSQLDTLQVKKKKEETEQALAIFFPKCRTKHPWKEFPLDQIEVCRICSEDHATCNFPSLPRLKAIYQRAFELDAEAPIDPQEPI